MFVSLIGLLSLTFGLFFYDQRVRSRGKDIGKFIGPVYLIVLGIFTMYVDVFLITY